jgi:hypothetical protein
MAGGGGGGQGSARLPACRPSDWCPMLQDASLALVCTCIGQQATIRQFTRVCACQEGREARQCTDAALVPHGGRC